jgi:phosphatidylglycerophosphate synthase
MLTLIGFAGALWSGVAYALSSWEANWLWLAILGYFINWFGDSLDGSLARYRNIERPSYGYFIDHSTDAFATLLLAMGFGLSPYVDMNIAMFAVSGYLLLSIHTFLAARVIGDFRLSYLSGGPTELRLFLISLTLGMIAFGDVRVVGSIGIFDLFIAIAGALFIALYVRQTYICASQLAKEADITAT